MNDHELKQAVLPHVKQFILRGNTGGEASNSNTAGHVLRAIADECWNGALMDETLAEQTKADQEATRQEAEVQGNQDPRDIDPGQGGSEQQQDGQPAADASQPHAEGSGGADVDPNEEPRV